MKVVGLNPNAVYWMDIFTYICYCNFFIVCLKRRNSGRGDGHFIKKTVGSSFITDVAGYRFYRVRVSPKDWTPFKAFFVYDEVFLN